MGGAFHKALLLLLIIQSFSSHCKRKMYLPEAQTSVIMFWHAGVVELADTLDLGDVTSVKVFASIARCGHSLVKTGSPVFINADQALRSASVFLAV